MMMMMRWYWMCVRTCRRQSYDIISNKIEMCIHTIRVHACAAQFLRFILSDRLQKKWELKCVCFFLKCIYCILYLEKEENMTVKLCFGWNVFFDFDTIDWCWWNFEVGVVIILSLEVVRKFYDYVKFIYLRILGKKNFVLTTTSPLIRTFLGNY